MRCAATLASLVSIPLAGELPAAWLDRGERFYGTLVLSGVVRTVFEYQSGTRPSARLALGRLTRQSVSQIVPALGGKLLAAARPRGSRASLDLAIAQHEHVGHLLLLRQPDLVLHPARRVVDFDADAPCRQHRGQLNGRVVVPVSDRDHD